MNKTSISYPEIAWRVVVDWCQRHSRVVRSGQLQKKKKGWTIDIFFYKLMLLMATTTMEKLTVWTFLKPNVWISNANSIA